MAQEVKFLDMFGCCAALRDKCGGLELAMVKNVVVSREKRKMDIAAGFAAPGTPSDIAMLEWRIAAEYGFTRVKITGNTPAAAPAEKKAAPPKKEAKPAPKKAESGEVLFGKLPKDNHRTDISELTLQSGTVSVTGKVFAADSRKIQKTNAAVLSFDMTDYTGSIHVSKYIRQGDDQSILDKIRVGDYLTVRGDVIFNRYDNDMAIDVAAIAKETAPQRQDTAEGDKRVELHLHTRYSTLDALTDADKTAYAALCLDDDRNRWWGYDFRKDFDGTPYEDYFLAVAREDYARSRAVNFAVRLDGALIGEVVLYRFDSRGGAELGCRVSPGFAGHGYGTEAFAAVADWALYRLHLAHVVAKCYKENDASYRMLSSCMHRAGEDETFFYFDKEV